MKENVYTCIYGEKKCHCVCMRVCAHIGSGINTPGLNYSLSIYATLGKLPNFSKSPFPPMEIGIAMAPCA